ncbi:MAG: DNA internalization-related competence protein ComEC/Rec2 [Deltaproteobacteria bacterium]|nr:DNA internalization-related competence protein ComEC/Rec2 [Deltaproteobacteria bacterium]
MRLACWSAFLAAGIAFAVLGGPVGACALALPALAAAGAFFCLRAWNVAALALALLLGLCLGAREAALAVRPASVAEDRMVEVVGQVTGGPDVAAAPAALAEERGDAASEPELKRSHLRIEVESVGGRPVPATLVLLVANGVPDLAPGDWVRFAGRLYLPRGFANPGLPDQRLLARARGIDFVGAVRSPSDLQRIPGRPGWLAYARRWALRVRQAMVLAIDQRLREPAAGFVRAMVVGERTNVPDAVEDGFRAAGATHVLSVSGLHLAVVVALVFHFLKRLAARLPAWALRIPPKVLASLLALPVTGFYTLLTGEAIATVRSAIMAAVVLGATIVNRPLSLASSIGAAASLLLLRAPAAILDVSFQLSFASVIGLGLFARFLLPSTPAVRRRGWRRVGRWLCQSVSASVAACLVTTPIIAHHFGEITPAAPLGNLVLVPVVELAVLPCGLVGALLALAHPWLGVGLLWAAGHAAELALSLAEGFRRFAPVLLVRFPNACETVLLVGVAGCLLRALALHARSRKRWLVAATVAASLAATSLVARHVIRLVRTDLRVTFLDVGQGDSAVIEGPQGFVALIDGGGRFDGRLDTGARIVEPVLRAAGISRLDLVVLSHPHPDHLNGLLRVLERFPVGALWTSGDDGRNPVYGKLLALAGARCVPTPVPGTHAHAGLVVQAVGPWLAGHIGVPPGLSTNDASLVVRLAYAGRRVLFTGDIGHAGEAELLDRRAAGASLAADILKIPHHGSRHASGAEFLDAVAPSLAVASAGRFNRFGLPNPAALERYLKRHVQVLRTDRNGAVTVTVDEKGGLRVSCAHGCGP